MTPEKPLAFGKHDWIALALVAVMAFLYFWGLGEVPFHPDESTQIYMSKDLAALFRDPGSLAWNGSLPLNDEARIRAIDAPLAKYIIGAARWLAAAPPTRADWNWSASWEENASAGALPSSRQLLVSRAGITCAMIAGLWLYYLAVKGTHPGWLAIVSLGLLGLNPLVLLHGRRAMSEGVLIFGLGFFLWATTRKKHRPWLVGLALAAALNAKHTALALIPAALLAASLPEDGKGQPRAFLTRILQLGLAFLAFTALLNPFYWHKPWEAVQVGADARLALSRQQELDHLNNLEGNRAAAVQQGGVALVGNVYYTLPQIEEVGNYLAETRISRQEYLKNPLHTWGRGLIGGAISLALALSGLVLTVRKIRLQPPPKRRKLLIWLTATLGLVLVLLFPLPWQRYVIPLLPLSAFWIARALDPLQRIWKSKTGEG